MLLYQIFHHKYHQIVFPVIHAQIKNVVKIIHSHHSYISAAGHISGFGNSDRNYILSPLYQNERNYFL